MSDDIVDNIKQKYQSNFNIVYQYDRRLIDEDRILDSIIEIELQKAIEQKQNDVMFNAFYGINEFINDQYIALFQYIHRTFPESKDKMAITYNFNKLRSHIYLLKKYDILTADQKLHHHSDIGQELTTKDRGDETDEDEDEDEDEAKDEDETEAKDDEGEAQDIVASAI